MNEQEQTQEISEEPTPAKLDYKDGQRLLAEGNSAMAANAFHNALVGFEEEGDDHGMANANDKLGDLCAARGDFTQSIAYYQKALEICARREDLFSVVSLQKKIAAAHRGIRQFDLAINTYLDLLETYEKIHSPASAVAILTLMAETYHEMGELEKAADSYKTIASIHGNFGHPKEQEEFLGKVTELERIMEEES